MEQRKLKPSSFNHHMSCFLTSQPAIKVRVGGHLEAGMRHQEATNVGEAGVNMLPHILQFFMLVLFHLYWQTDM